MLKAAQADEDAGRISPFEFPLDLEDENMVSEEIRKLSRMQRSYEDAEDYTKYSEAAQRIFSLRMKLTELRMRK